MFDSPLSRSAYDVLGVDPSADAAAIRRAFRQRLRATHPDTGGDAALFIELQRAWELVGDDAARAAYDRGHGFAEESDWRGWSAPAPRSTRPRARAFGQAGARRRTRYERLVRERHGDVDPYDPAQVRSASLDLRMLLARALAEEASGRTIDDLGMGYTVWHGAPTGDDTAIDHLVLGPSGLYGVMSHDFGGFVRFRSDEIVGEGVDAPVADLLQQMRVIARAARVRFGGAIVVLPDDDLPTAITPLAGARQLPVVVTSRSALATVLRAGVPGARPIGGNELFDVRTRLQQSVRIG